MIPKWGEARKEENGGRKKKKWDRKDFRSNKGCKEKASLSIQKTGDTTSVGMSGQLVLGIIGWLYRAECCSVTFFIGNREQRGH